MNAGAYAWEKVTVHKAQTESGLSSQKHCVTQWHEKELACRLIVRKSD